MSNPPPIQVCTHADHPAKRHGHYGYGGRYWCSDFNSPLLSEENNAQTRNGWILIFEKALAGGLIRCSAPPIPRT